VILLLLTVAVRAESFNFNFTGQNFSASGTLTGNLVSPGVYQITQMTGSLSDFHDYPLNQIWGLYPPGEINGANNLLFVNEPFVDSLGINFLVSDQAGLALAHDNLVYLITGCYEGACSPNNHITNRGDLVVTYATPEHSTILLFTTGLSLCALPLKRRLLRN
jgi:hypothetical protein